jgi:hypothetical protein
MVTTILLESVSVVSAGLAPAQTVQRLPTHEVIGQPMNLSRPHCEHGWIP